MPSKKVLILLYMEANERFVMLSIGEEEEPYKNLKKAFIILIDWPAPKLAPVQAIMHGRQMGAQPWG